MHACPLFLHSCKHLIGGRDRTAIFDHSRCHVEEASFQEAVSDGEAQTTLVANIERKLCLCILSIVRYVLSKWFEPLPQAKKLSAWLPASG